MAVSQIPILALRMTMSQINIYNDIHQQYHAIYNIYDLQNYNKKLEIVYDIADACESVLDSIEFLSRRRN